ncbi:ECF-type sigma factor [Wenzhouxiangella marina]|uniref:RNA polymerase, sigma subunit, ECF family n=1 Tax=Wenzhouxiangella marina TaxID=1579979 RepID=A0A0K0XYC8_9GAMM|nr:ECF-type sigma factor [Wenzhouxiangella marina]AKS42688.1 RNA polymerase, sigma subunit, ECF family [Wenzhouxiangella marina]MBB6088623.1 RNA polymerase sigma factor (TIGR02999 family) [Wenzhouxiangella marina]
MSQQQTDLTAGFDPADTDRIQQLYREMRQIARRERRRLPSATLNTTALVHEVWLRISPEDHQFRDHRHFLGLAAVAMRRLVVDHARYRLAQKRGGDQQQVELGDADGARSVPIDRILDIDEALGDLERIDERLRQLVELRFFAGLPNDEAADVLGISPRTAARDWARARALLKTALDAG